MLLCNGRKTPGTAQVYAKLRLLRDQVSPVRPFVHESPLCLLFTRVSVEFTNPFLRCRRYYACLCGHAELSLLCIFHVPLRCRRYYACLCGHAELVEYLLEVGARCEANTFDGERCLYGALTDEIRRVLLRRHAVTRHTMRRDVYQEFLRR